MNSWNELDGSTFFNKVFTSPILIGEIELFSINIDNSRPIILMEFDIPEYPDAPPDKWKQSGFNTCRIGLNCSNIEGLLIKNIPTHEKLRIKITSNEKKFRISASSENSLIEFTTKHPLLCGPSAYSNAHFTDKKPKNMRTKLKYELQPLRVPSGWTITINNLYEVDLTPETADWFSSSVLLGGARQTTGHCFDSRVEPEGDPSGEFVIEFLTIKYDNKGNPLKNSEISLGEFKTKNKMEFIKKIEDFMLEA